MGVLLIITVLLAAGASQRLPPPETADTLPKDSAVADALAEIDELFGDTSDSNVVTLIFRGDALTPVGLSHMASVIDDIVSQPGVPALLAPGDSIVVPSLLYQQLLNVDDLRSVTQAEIDSVSGMPEVQVTLSALTGRDASGMPVAIAIIRLLDTGDDRVEEVERLIHELVADVDGPLQVSSISPVVVEDEYRRATEEGMAPLIGLALLLIAVLILLFMRTLSDLFLTLAGLLISLIWVIGVEGWLGPKALGLTGPPNSLTALVPIIVISLTVDYAIQMISHYREQRLAGLPVQDAVRTGLRRVSIPLTLAAATTIVSMLANLFSPLEIVGDFGIIAGLGVGMSLIVMLTLVPAGRMIIDRRREARGTLTEPRSVSQALPGIERAAELLGTSVSRRPAPYLLAVVALTIGLGFAATGLESKFTIRDILPRGGTILEDWDALDEAVGGSIEVANVLIKAEATETRTLLNLRDFANAFEHESRRPRAAAGPVTTSFELLVRDWTTDSGEPGDKYDPELAALFQEASAGLNIDSKLMQEFLVQLELREPTLAHSLANNPDGIDTILVQFPTVSADPYASERIQEDVEAIWLGDDEAVTATSQSIISVTVTNAITEGQTETISTTIAVALGILTLFFYLTIRQPLLSLIAVAPIVFVLIWVLGTMALLGIPYTIITSIITALSIGIGVDYTIHVIHRYREEFTRLRDPEKAAIRTLATTGSALLGSALTTALGLGVLIASPLAASQQFGITAAITIGYSLIVSLLVVPPAMTVWGAYQNMRLRSTMQRTWDELDEAIDDAQRRHEQESDSS